MKNAFYSDKKISLNNIVCSGPASSVVERSLRNNSFTRGPRFESCQGLYFSVANFYSHTMIDGNLQLSDVLHRISQPIDRNGSCGNLYY